MIDCSTAPFGTTLEQTTLNSDIIKKDLEAKSKPPVAPKVEIKKYESNKPSAFQLAPSDSKKSEPNKDDDKKQASTGLFSMKSGEGLSSFKGFGGFGQDNNTADKKTPLFGEKVDDSKPPARDTSNDKNTPDYKTLLTQFYKKHKPAKVTEVDKLLDKYKVRK